MESKKISFSFKGAKKIQKPKVDEGKEYIASVENNAIKVIHVENKQEPLPIIIPMKSKKEERPNRVIEGVEKVKEDTKDHETIEQMAVRELIDEARIEITNDKMKPKELSVPMTKFKADGAEESTLNDYEIIPVEKFGMAMLRGMGWNSSLQTSKLKLPEMRPKGLGLGAGKVDNKNKIKKEELALQSSVKVMSGKYKGFYGKVISISEDSARVIVELTMNNEVVSLSGFMLQPVTECEYATESKVLNKAIHNCNDKQSSNKKSQLREDLLVTPSTSREITNLYKDDSLHGRKYENLQKKRENKCYNNDIAQRSLDRSELWCDNNSGSETSD